MHFYALQYPPWSTTVTWAWVSTRVRDHSSLHVSPKFRSLHKNQVSKFLLKAMKSMELDSVVHAHMGLVSERMRYERNLMQGCQT